MGRRGPGCDGGAVEVYRAATGTAVHSSNRTGAAVDEIDDDRLAETETKNELTNPRKKNFI